MPPRPERGQLLRRLDPERIVIESVLVNPWRVRRFGEALAILAKTDPIDARLLFRYGGVPRRP
jgi:transposase